MANPTGPTTTSFPRRSTLTGPEMFWNQVPPNVQGANPSDYSSSADDLAGYVRSTIVPTDLSPTNNAIAAVQASVNALGAPLQSGGAVVASNLLNPHPTVGPAMKAAQAGPMWFASTAPTALSLTPAPVAALVNPVGSSKTLYVRALTVGAGVALNYSRCRIPLAGLTVGGTPATAQNGAAGGATPVGKLYGSPTGIAASDATREHSGQNETLTFDGVLAVPAGYALLFTAWSVVGVTGLVGLAGNAWVSGSWWEV